MLGYFQDKLSQPANKINIDLTKIARDGNAEEIVKLGYLIITLAVQSSNNQFFIKRIQAMDSEDQKELMIGIENIMGALKAKQETVNESKSELDVLRSENAALVEKVKYLQDLLSNQSGSTSESAHKNELIQLENQLQEMEIEKKALENTCSINASKLATLNEKLEEFETEKGEVLVLKEQLLQLHDIADKLQKSEILVEKYKKKIEDSSSSQATIKELEEKLQESNLRNASLDEQFQKIASLKPLIDTYKSQIDALEEKNSILHVEHLNLSFQVKEYKTKVKRYEAEHYRDSEKIMELEDSIKDMEFNLNGNPVQKESLLTEELSRLRELNPKIAQQEERIYLLESQLEDANLLKGKFQEDYQKTYKENISLLNQIQQLKSVPLNDDSMELVLKLNQAEKTIKRMKSETDMAGKLSKRASFDSRRVSIRESMTAKRESFGGVTPQDKNRQLVEENRKINARCQMLEADKAQLEISLNQIKQEYAELEKTCTSLKANLAVLDSTKTGNQDDTTKSLIIATQKLGQLNEQNSTLHTALKRAKDLILSQDKRIKELVSSGSNENFAEAINSLESTLKIREAELEKAKQELLDTRASARREQRLIMSAWYELGIQFQRKAAASQGPVSWLGKQRLQLGNYTR